MLKKCTFIIGSVLGFMVCADLSARNQFGSEPAGQSVPPPFTSPADVYSGISGPGKAFTGTQEMRHLALDLAENRHPEIVGILLKAGVVTWAGSVTIRCNGEGGIRTRGTRKGHTGFRNRLDKPLRHLSKSLHYNGLRKQLKPIFL